MGEGDTGAPDLNSIFSAVSNLMTRSSASQRDQQHPTSAASLGASSSAQMMPAIPSHAAVLLRTAGTSGDVDGGAGIGIAPRDLRDVELPESSAPAPTERAPHVNDPRPPPAFQGKDGGQSLMLLSVLRAQEDKANPGRLPRIEEVPEDEEEEEETVDTDGTAASETKAVTLPDPPAESKRGGRGGGGGGGGRKVNINDLA